MNGKLVHGIGVKDAEYVVKQFKWTLCADGKQKRVLVWTCPFYRTWEGVLRRCYSQKLKNEHPTYKDALCHPDWLLFSNFKKWMEQQDWEGKQLDKDIVVVGNKLYSEETCAFVSPSTNLFVTARDASRGEYPLGVYYSKSSMKYKAQCCNLFTKKREYLGYFDTPEEAHEAWRKRKHELAQLVANTETDQRVVEALKKRYSVEAWYTNS